MRAPPGLPARIRSDASNAFAHHTMAVRVPAILEGVLERHPEYPPQRRERLTTLAAALRSNQPLPALSASTPHPEEWVAELATRSGEGWLSTDWFFAENYVYRCLADATAFWTEGRDPFCPNKLEEYASATHREALEAAIGISGSSADWLEALLNAAVFGNRMDSSFAASRERGTRAASADLIVDDRAEARRLLESRAGPVHFIIDNAGAELSVDLVLAARLLERLGANVVLHVKVHPAFVSDAVAGDVLWFLRARDASAAALWNACSPEARSCRDALCAALAAGRLRIAPHPFWNGPRSLWDLPSELERQFSVARLVILKGDAHYRRAVGDALWPPDTPFGKVTGYFPAPLLALRTLKSDAIVGLPPGMAAQLDREDPRWRVNGQRGIASLSWARLPR